MSLATPHSKKSLVIGAALLAVLLSEVAACASVSEIKKVPPDALVLDVRTPKEYEEWHFPGARNIPVYLLDEQLSGLGDKDQIIVVYCRSGSRSSSAKRLLLEAGFTHVLNGGGLRDMRPLAAAVQ